MTPQLNALIKDYIDDFNKKQGLSYVVKPSIPVVWFGDMAAYMKSEKKVVSVALNPSKEEFTIPRFEDVDLQIPDAVNSLEKTLNEYFKRNPYKWFKSFENAISALGASYYEDRAENSALHIDIYSAIATDPTWRHLNDAQKNELARIDLFKRLFELLNPDVTLVSVGKDVFEKVFLPQFEFKCIEKIISGKKTFFIKKYCRENQILISGSNFSGTPFGGMGYEVVRRTIQEMVGSLVKCQVTEWVTSTRNLLNTTFDALPESDVNRLSPKLGTGVEPRAPKDNTRTNNEIKGKAMTPEQRDEVLQILRNKGISGCRYQASSKDFILFGKGAVGNFFIKENTRSIGFWGVEPVIMREWADKRLRSFIEQNAIFNGWRLDVKKTSKSSPKGMWFSLRVDTHGWYDHREEVVAVAVALYKKLQSLGIFADDFTALKFM